MDPELPVVRLCVAGMQAEAEGRAGTARALFQQAWDSAADDYEACIAAHYLARHQNSPEETLRWNQECLDRADRVGDERVAGFYPSLHLNMGHACRQLGRPALAHTHFLRAAERVEQAPEGQYGDWNRFAIAAGLRDTAGAYEDFTREGSAREGSAGEGGSGAGGVPRSLDEAVDGRVRELVSRWCARGELMALGLALPAYLGYLGTAADRVRLRSALHMVHAARRLPADEQAELGAVIGSAALR
ncbi:hypothetical protein ACFVJW_04915 [Streptomyces libani]|uniref:Tetratricopeptide repeat protein n=1 Tax=Streptomyces nigrescens TaxID=1920 RepID=A0A640TN15_STRNI|nr:hypothetical protein [Streptomyces libani]WAT97864.1 hypothetical protein STRLI_003856 [Streptomyces libani subsp. libani]GFE23415.1 hypothetical protein Sliba_38680 [Streptomyces libani subsp. libani]GGV92954.1 hypothetical protein GCM10010500_27370 [Streptomyces libani subsp. libani]